MESNGVKYYQGIYIILYSKSKNYNYYKCPHCKGEYKEIINTGDIITHKKHSTKCYNERKFRKQIIPTCDNSLNNNNNLEINNIPKILSGLECEEKKNNNSFLRFMIEENDWKKDDILAKKCLNKIYKLSDNYVAKVIKNNTNFEILIKEAEIHLSINHPRIVNCLNYFHINNKFSLIIEYCSNGTLLHTKNDEVQNIRHLNQIIEAVKFLHTNKIVHRDIKLDNIFLDSENNVKLGDFGCASYGIKFSDFNKGTYSYMSPQIKENKEYTLKCDVWSLGITSYCLLSGCESIRSLDLLDFMQELLVSDKCNADQLKTIIVKKINELDFTGMSDKSIENIKKMLNYEEDERSSIFDIEF